MVRRLITESEMKAAIREYLDADVADEDTRRAVQELEMQLASPGEWEAAKHESDPDPSN